MSEYDTYNEKLMVVDKLEKELAIWTDRKNILDAQNTKLTNKLNAKNVEKTNADDDLVASRSMIKSNPSEYKNKLQLCEDIGRNVASLNLGLSTVNNHSTDINQRISDLNTAKATADAELAAALAALP